MNPDNLEKFIPYYLTKEVKEGLKKALLEWREKPIRFYADNENPEPNQGDGIAAVDLYNPNTGASRAMHVVVITNSCDIAQGDTQSPYARVLVAPLIDFEKYLDTLLGLGWNQGKIESHKTSVINQEVTTLFHIPSIPKLENKDYIISFNDLHSIPLSRIRESPKKIYDLHLHGFYLFIFKLSIHFCRFGEALQRT